MALIELGIVAVALGLGAKAMGDQLKREEPEEPENGPTIIEEYDGYDEEWDQSF